DFLRSQWRAQVVAQTKPLPHTYCQAKNNGKTAVEEALRLRQIHDNMQKRISDLQSTLTDMDTPIWEAATTQMEIDSTREALRHAHAKVHQKESALGVVDRQSLRHLLNSPFLTKRMNARALKMRIQERLRSHKFELDRLEQSYRKQQSDHCINEQTQNSVKRQDPGIAELAQKYNKLCEEMQTLINRNQAP
ncbi:hypothetical protein BDP27DRAFT_1200709, partial [Rhodocollybia butyracea]